ncbi:MarR family winged helix-turn-helix transcriptional regulator [Corynebacterium glyciniphilum]|uniref:MarR family winged helix-turn-helix transcriptional regulator n=1 Tax=Corynebacterium glyciniphilum TaxID=1404244 RepID=UPI003FD3DE30
MGDETQDDQGTLERQRDRMISGLRAYGKTYGEVGRQFAAGLDLHFTDASAVIEILAAEEGGTPLTPARLSERIGLTTGATSSLLRRLESAGHIVRSRDQEDRRVVTLRSTPGIQATADRFFDPLGTRISAVLSQYPPELLSEVEKVIEDLRVSMEVYISEEPNVQRG